jgi:hypothetical protein
VKLSEMGVSESHTVWAARFMDRLGNEEMGWFSIPVHAPGCVRCYTEQQNSGGP